MKKFIFMLLVFVVMNAQAELRITGAIDGPLDGGTPKAVEFYSDVAISNLSIYGFGSANNGGGTDGEEFTFTNSITVTAGTFFYLAMEQPQFNAWFGFDPDFIGGSAVGINGDDALELFKNGVVIDTFGDINTDGTGEPWEYLDGWAYRKNGTGLDPTINNTNNYIYSGPNALDGETSNETAAFPFPVGTYNPVPEPAIFGLVGLALLFFRRK